MSGRSWRFVAAMAWRDSRGSRRRLLLYMASIVAGVAALVAVASFRADLEAAVELQSRSLLGADLSISSQLPFDEGDEELIASIAGRRSRQVEFTSMASFPASDGSRLVSVRALEGDFPYYGDLVTDPPEAARAFRSGRTALVEDGLLLQFGAELGDMVRLGAVDFRIVGRLRSVVGEVPAMGLVSPRVYIPLAQLEATGLVQRGSLATYRAFIALGEGGDLETTLQRLRPELRRQHLRYDTAARRQRSLGRTFANLGRFLMLVGTTALLVGGIGVASAVHLHVRDKIAAVAVLRCLGCRGRQALAIFLLQTLVVGMAGALIGVFLGIGVQLALPRILRDFLPLEVRPSLSLAAVAEGVGVGTGVALAFGALPLLAVRRVSPLLALRGLDEETVAARHDPLRWAAMALLVAATAAYMGLRAAEPATGLALFAGTAAVFALLVAVGALLRRLARRLASGWSAYEVRQGIANLYRPRNQTVVLLLALGLATFLVVTMAVVEASLVGAVGDLAREHEVDVVLWDVQPDQVAGVHGLLGELGIALGRDVPMVPMRLAEVRGTPVERILDDNPRAGWAVRWTYNSTYRDRLTESERIVAGEFTGRVAAATEPVPVSVDRQVLEDLDAELGDELVFDVQGIPVRATIGSVRAVDWGSGPPNFLVVFPEGAIEAAPQFRVMTGRAGSRQAAADLQRRIVRDYPNVSVVDLAMVMQVVHSLLDEVSVVIRFLTSFTVAAGFLVLVAALVTSRTQRVREAALLRTLGASRRQIRHIAAAEYLALGALASLAGIVLAVTAGWLLARLVFEVEAVVPAVPLLGASAFVTGLTVLIGMLNGRGVWRRPPLEVLRAEAG